MWAVNNIQSNIFLRDYCLSWKQPVIELHLRQGGRGPLNSKNCSMSIPLTVVNFFQNDFVAQKLARWRWIVTEKYTVNSYACKPRYCPGRIYISWAPGTLGFLQYFPVKFRWRQTTSYLSAGPLALSYMLNTFLVNGYCITFIKRLDKGLS